MVYCKAGEAFVRFGGSVMEYEDTGAKRTQMIALLMTALLIGGTVFYVM